ncbi:MAG: amidohydrolase [Bacteroidota bacterium]
MTSISKLKARAEELYPEIVEIRRHLHQNPEVSYKEYETTAFIISKLKELGIEVHQPLETGCVGILKGGISSERVIALRADIDALPMDEAGEHKQAFFSKHKGAAHCCGHDAHTANLLGVARVLSELRSEVPGTVVFIFQPGEEKLPGGAKLLCETGILQELGIDSVFGLHTSPMHPVGSIAVKSGPIMGAPDEFELELIGKGGHAAKPHETVDPIVMAGQFISAVQTISSRSVDPTEAVVVTIGKIEAGTAHNIIPESAYMLGTIRTLSTATAELVHARLEEIVKGIATACGGSYNLKINRGYPVVRNAELETERLIKAAGEVLGADMVQRMERPIMAGEDFAFYQQVFPGTFFFAGTASKEADSFYPWHHPKYNVDEAFFKSTIPIMASIALNNGD